jgi:hypothetical protein
VMCRMMQMPLSRMRVMGCRLVVTRLVMPCGFAVVLSGVLKVLSCFVMMFCRLFRHLCSSQSGFALRRVTLVLLY